MAALGDLDEAGPGHCRRQGHAVRRRHEAVVAAPDEEGRTGEGGHRRPQIAAMGEGVGLAGHEFSTMALRHRDEVGACRRPVGALGVGHHVGHFGENTGELGGSEYLNTVHQVVAGEPPRLDLKREAALQQLIVKLIREGAVESAHDCSEGGLAVAIAECTFDSGGLGVTADLPAVRGDAFSTNATLFGESASRIVVSVSPSQRGAVVAAATAAGIPVTEIGTVGGDRIRVSVNGRAAVDSTV